MNLAELFSRSHAAELDLLKGLLTLDPTQRLTATQVNEHTTLFFIDCVCYTI